MSFLIGLILFVIILSWCMNRIARLKFKFIKQNANITNQIISEVPENGLYFADIMPSNDRLILPITELNQHLYVNATTGGGKTTLFLRIIEESLKYKMPIVFIDGKGSFDLVEKLSNIAKKNNRTFKYFTFAKKEDTSCYDFLGTGTKDELRNKIMNLLINKENEFYYERLTTFIAMMFNILDKGKKSNLIKNKIDLAFIYRLILADGKLIELANLVKDEVAQNYFVSINDEKEKPHERILNILTPIILSEYGELFNLHNKNNIINISESITNNDIVLFMLDSSTYTQDTERFGKIIIDDINVSFSLLNRDNVKKNTLIIFDEFGAYASKSIATTISMHRSNGLHAIIGSQSLETIEAGPDGKVIVSGIMANCNTQIMLKSVNQYDLELFSNKAGTSKSYDMTYQVRTDADGGQTGLGSMRIGNKYKVDIEQLRGLHAGVGYIYRSSINKVERIKIVNVVA